MLEKRLKGDVVAYYWNPPLAATKAGFTLNREPLGQDYNAACERANNLNRHLDDWRAGRDAERSLDLQQRAGTLDWLFERYFHSRAFDKVSARVQPDYRRELTLVTDTELKDGRRAGALSVQSISARFVDKLYERLLNGPRGPRRNTANKCVTRSRRAWDVVQRLYPDLVPIINPFEGVERAGGSAEKVPASRDEAFALHRQLIANGHPALAVVPLICFEWLQRPENVLAGKFRWTDYKTTSAPGMVQIEHHKTGQMVLLRLNDSEGRLYPEIEDYLDALPRRGIAAVVTPGTRGPERCYSKSYAQRMVREARRQADLPEHVTMDACRHGGMTLLGDAALNEQGVMALSGHRTPDAARLYIHHTNTQRLRAARQRRNWIDLEHSGDKSQNEPKIESQNESLKKA